MRLIWSKLASWRLFFLKKDLVLHFKQIQFVGPTFFNYIQHSKMQHFCSIFQLTRCIRESWLNVVFVVCSLGENLLIDLFYRYLKKQTLLIFLSFPLGENVLIDLFWQNWRLLKAQSLKSWNSKLCLFCERTACWKSTHWHLLTNLVTFESSKALRAWKSKLCSQKRSMSRFPSSGKLTKWAKFAFSNLLL